MPNCPFCDELISESDTDICSQCGQSFEPVPLHIYGKPAEFLEESLHKVRSGSMSPTGLNDLFPHLLGAVQHVLNKASSDISSNFKILEKVVDDVPEEARKSTSEFIDDFGEIQEELNETLLSLGELFGSSKSIQEFEENSQEIEQSLLELQSSVDALGVLKSESEISALAEVPRDPFPDEVGEALDHFEKAMDSLIRYMEQDRDLADLSECVEQTDKAKAKLFKLVMMNSMS